MEPNMEQLAQKINEACDWIQKIYTDVDAVPPHLVKQLAYPAARLANMMVPFQKLNETIYAAENKMHVNPHQQGHDLVDGKGRHIEHKGSKATRSVITDKKTGETKKRKHRHCNVHWVFPPMDLSERERRKRLVELIDEKTDNGYMVVEVKDGLDRPLNTYKISSSFLKEYFGRIYQNKERINLGCDQCDKCGHFHRIKNLHDASKKLEDNPNTDIDILFKSLNIFKQVKSQCG